VTSFIDKGLYLTDLDQPTTLTK